MNGQPQQALSPSAALSGHYTLRPGASPSIVGQRPVLGAGRLGRLLRGQQGLAVEHTLGHLFTLCAHAHRRTARLALNAANPSSTALTPLEWPVLLRLETARDHLRSMALEWRQRQPGLSQTPPALDWLRDCPLSLTTASVYRNADDAWQTLARLRDWLGSRVLGQAVPDWLSRHREPEALAHWCRAHAQGVFPARCLDAWYHPARVLRPETRALDLLDADTDQQTARLQQLALAIAAATDFVQQPSWLGHCAETGPWTRLRHRSDQRKEHSAWSRLSARWMELMEIAAADPLSATDGSDPLLASGALRLGEGQAIAWCEMARGLLLHWVRLDAQGRVDDYRVLAPTEWNFHPEGALARALAALPGHDAASAGCLAAAYDPCVDCTVQATSANAREMTHA